MGVGGAGGGSNDQREENIEIQKLCARKEGRKCPPYPHPQKRLVWKSKEVCEVMLGCWGWVWSMVGMKLKNQAGDQFPESFCLYDKRGGLICTEGI